MPRAIICTNKPKRWADPGGTYILRAAAEAGEVLWSPHTGQAPEFLINFADSYITAYHGHAEPMTDAEAARFGADFGLWYES